jgi:hypothetical protein
LSLVRELECDGRLWDSNNLNAKDEG